MFLCGYENTFRICIKITKNTRIRQQDDTIRYQLNCVFHNYKKIVSDNNLQVRLPPPTHTPPKLFSHYGTATMCLFLYFLYVYVQCFCQNSRGIIKKKNYKIDLYFFIFIFLLQFSHNGEKRTYLRHSALFSVFVFQILFDYTPWNRTYYIRILLFCKYSDNYKLAILDAYDSGVKVKKTKKNYCTNVYFISRTVVVLITLRYNEILDLCFKWHLLRVET